MLWLNTRVVDRVEAYLARRTPAAEGLALAYRGLDPDAPLFPARESVTGGPSSEWAAGGETYGTTKWLSEPLCSIFQKAPIRASPSRSARLTRAHRMLSGGADEAAVAQVLGLQRRELLRRLRSSGALPFGRRGPGEGDMKRHRSVVRVVTAGRVAGPVQSSVVDVDAPLRRLVTAVALCGADALGWRQPRAQRADARTEAP